MEGSGYDEREKEQIKLRAAFINSLALIFFSAGVLAPLVSSIYFTGITRDKAFLATASSLVCFGITIALHYAAWWHLKEMDR
ncbi:hypothetical protein QBK99_07570 [Corticibacterium sp. UT-5YL-CI-8]|nr:hypothetical protein [Tianweitania sp. UT-5YL-CI-8]